MESTIRYIDGVRFEAESRGHRVLCDQPLDNSGTDTAMRPPALLLTSLGTCAAFYALHYLRARSLPVDGLEVRVTADKALRPDRLESFRIAVLAPDLEPKHREGILRSVKLCLVHNTLLSPPSIETVIQTAG